MNEPTSPQARGGRWCTIPVSLCFVRKTLKCYANWRITCTKVYKTLLSPHCLLQCSQIHNTFLSPSSESNSDTLSFTSHMLLNVTASLVPPQVGSCPAPNPVLYYKVMTPQWLEDYASLSQLIAATPENLHFKINTARSRLLKVPLFQKGELPTDDIIVTITVHLEDPPTSDSDFLPSICDGTVCNGLYISDSGNYPNNACNYVTIESGITFTSIGNTGGCGAPITYQHFPNTATVTFYPVNRWASFSIAPSGGYTTAGTFSRQLDLTKGLYLEVYGSDVNEEYKLMFMEVKVTKN